MNRLIVIVGVVLLCSAAGAQMRGAPTRWYI